MKEIILDAKAWERPDDLYGAFFKAVGSPSWHGRNFNALKDSIEAGQINTIEVPYRLVIRNYDRIGPGAAEIAANFVSLIREMAARNCPVEIRIERSERDV